MPHLLRATIGSPVGALTLIAADGVLCAIDFETSPPPYGTRREDLLARRFGAATVEPAGPDASSLAPWIARLARYFDGDLTALDDLPVDPRGTPFQRRVWLALRDIPAGRTLSYGSLGARLGRPTAARAIGLANGANPIAIVLPCHRVIGANGALTGYGGGIERKRWLLEHEGVLSRTLL